MNQFFVVFLFSKQKKASRQKYVLPLEFRERYRSKWCSDAYQKKYDVIHSRNHQNDLENIPAFVFLGLLYVLTQPDPIMAVWHFRLFAGSRLLHTICYQNGLQPWRSLSFMVGTFALLSMAAQILLKAKFWIRIQMSENRKYLKQDLPKGVLTRRINDWNQE